MSLARLIGKVCYRWKSPPACSYFTIRFLRGPQLKKDAVIRFEEFCESLRHFFPDRSFAIFHFANMVLADPDSLRKFLLRKRLFVTTSAEHKARLGIFFDIFLKSFAPRYGFLARLSGGTLDLQLCGFLRPASTDMARSRVYRHKISP